MDTERHTGYARYARHIAFDKIGREGQELLSRKSATIVGAGAIGTVAAELLVRAGVGHVIIIDKDLVEWSNLQSQTCYEESDVDELKAARLRDILESINHSVKIEGLSANLDASKLHWLDSDVVLDCVDNLETRFLINEYTAKKRIPWVHAAAIQDKGELLVVTPDRACYNCIYPEAKEGKSCQELGILGSAAHIVGALQAKEAIKILIGAETEKDLLRIDVWNNRIDHIKVKKTGSCTVCRGEYPLLDAKEEAGRGQAEFEVIDCKTKAALSAKPKKNIKIDLDEIRKNFKVLIDTPILLVIKEEDEIIVHSYGELLFKTAKDKDLVRRVAEKIYKKGVKCTSKNT